MGLYINSGKQTKEAWLKCHGEMVDREIKWEDIPPGKLALFLIENSTFTSLGIAFDEDDFETFMEPDYRYIEVYVADVQTVLHAVLHGI